MGYEPASVKHAMIGSAVIGVLNAIPAFGAMLLVNSFLAADRDRIGLGETILFGLVVGVLGTFLTALMNRSEQKRQQKTVPHGARVAVAEVAGMTLVGGVLAPLMAGTPGFLGWGLLAGFLGSLPNLLIMAPWKPSGSEAEFERKTKDFGDMTRETVDEIQQERAAKAREKHGDPWDQRHNQGWWT